MIEKFLLISGLVVFYSVGALVAPIIKRFLEKPKFNNFKLHSLIVVFLLMVCWHQFFADKQNVMLFAVFFIIGLLSPVLISGIKDCLRPNDKRLEIIKSLVIILALPLTLGLLENVVSKNREIEKDIGKVFERIDELKKSSGGKDRAFYDNLLREQASATDPIGKSILELQIKSFQSSYLETEAFVKRIPLCKFHVDCRLPGNQETEQSEIINGIYAQRTHSYWGTRAKVAYLLKFTTNERIRKTNEVSNEKLDWGKIIVALLDRMASGEDQLIVSKTALDSFRFLVPDFNGISPAPTKQNPETIFDFDKAVEYWNKNSTKIISRLRSASD